MPDIDTLTPSQKFTEKRDPNKQSPADIYRSLGFTIFRDVISTKLISKIQDTFREVVQPFDGVLPRHIGPPAGHKFSKSGEIINGLLNPHKNQVQAIKPFTDAFLELVCQEIIAKCLYTVNGESGHTIFQTILFLISPQTGPHIDSFSHDTWPRGHAPTVWIPLEDIHPDAGPPCVYPYEELMKFRPSFPSNDKIWDEENPNAAANLQYTKALVALINQQGYEPYPLSMKAGDLAIWNSMTPHSTLPNSRKNASRRSIQMLMRPNRFDRGTYIGPKDATL